MKKIYIVWFAVLSFFGGILNVTGQIFLTGASTACTPGTEVYNVANSINDSISWTVTGGTIIGASNADSVIVQWVSAGSASVTVTVTDSLGIDTTIIYPVNLNHAPAPVISGPVTLCLPASSVYRVGSPGINNFTWSVTEGTILGSENADSIAVQWNNITGTGTVSVTASNAFGCDSTTTMNVSLSVTPSPFITGQQTLCGAQAAIYSSSTSNASVYNWSVHGGNMLNNNGDNILVQWDSSITGSIFLTAVNAEGCDTTLYYFVDVYPQPSPVVTGPVVSCSPATVNYSQSQASNDTYNWTVINGTISSNPTIDSIQVQWNTTGTGTVLLTQTNAYGCDTTVTTEVILNPNPSPHITGIDLLCQEDTATYSVTSVQGHNYDWNITGGAIISFTVSNTIDVYWFGHGLGSVRINQTSQEGCATQDLKVVSINPAPVTDVTGALVACLNDQLNYLSDQREGSSYSWSVNGGTINGNTSQPSAVVQWTIAGEAVIAVTETDSNGCSAVTPVEVLVNSLPVASIIGNQEGCVDLYGSSYSATTMDSVFYQWSFNGGNIIGNNGDSHVNVLWNGTGISEVDLLTLNTATGCSSNTSMQVLVDSMPQPQITSTSLTGCAPFVTTLGSSLTVANYSYQWTFGDSTSSQDVVTTHTFINPGSYAITLVATNNTGCYDTVRTQVKVFNPPVANFIVDISDGNFHGEETTFILQNITEGAVQYLWTFGDGNTSADFEPAYQYTESGTYDIMLMTTDIHGCKDSMQTAVEIRVPETIYVPSAFTPNGDSRNDIFSLTSHNITELHISIFDRWGKVVYSSDNSNFQWDGTYFGHRLDEGTYVYEIYAKGFHGQGINRNGTVSIVK